MQNLFKIVLTLFAGVLIWTLTEKVVDYKLDKLRSADAISASTITADVREKQLQCLAQNIYHEAGSEPFEGKAAVAQVTLNRVDSGKFPGDVCRVVYQKNVVYDRVLCQFSWYCEGKGGVKPKNNVAYEQSMEAAKKVLLEGFRLPSLTNAMYYHADYVNPGWNKQQVAKSAAIFFTAINQEINHD